MDRDGLADFLRRRRDALSPEDVGLVGGPRRRADGLRREEVAQLAHISTDFYTRLEQRRGARPSQATVGALARALHLDRVGRDHLFALAGHTPPPHVLRSDTPSAGLLRVLAQIETPAMIVSDLLVPLRQNRMAEALLGDQSGFTGPSRSMLYRWFAEPERRSLYPAEDHDLRGRHHVAALRAVHGRPVPDPEADELVTVLLAESAEFAALWERHEVGSRAGTEKRFIHPLVGALTLDCQNLTSENVTEQLVVFSAAPGSVDESRLAMLAELAAATPVGGD